MNALKVGRGGRETGAPLAPLRTTIVVLDRFVFRSVEALAVACLAGVAALTFYQVISRFIFNAPLSWSDPLTRALMIYAVFLGAVRLFREGTLIAVSLTYTLAGPRLRKVLDWLHLVGAMAFLLVACFYGFQLAWRVRFQVMAGVGVPISYAYLAIPVGALLCALAILAARFDRR